MATNRNHYERAFEAFLRATRVPYVSVNEARRAFLPPGARLSALEDGTRTVTLKNFDFVVYGSHKNQLIEVKGRRVGGSHAGSPDRPGRLESWVTLDDVTAMERWETLFGGEFRAAFVFVYHCVRQPPDALFQQVFEHEGRWYAVRAVEVGAYRAHMVTRSDRWGTVHLPAGVFDRVSGPLRSGEPLASGPSGGPPRVSSTPHLRRSLEHGLRLTRRAATEGTAEPGARSLPRARPGGSIVRCAR